MTEASTLSGRVLDALVSAGLLTSEQVVSAVEQADGSGGSVGKVLAERGLVSAADLRGVLEGEMGVPQVDIESYEPEPAALELLPVALARTHGVLPLFEVEGMLTVAVGDPYDVFDLDEVARHIGLEVEPVLADSASILEGIIQYYGEVTEEIAEGGVEPTEEVATSAPEPELEPEPEHEVPIVIEAPQIVEVTEGDLAGEEEIAFSAADLFEVTEDGGAVPLSEATPEAEPTDVVAEATEPEEVPEPDEAPVVAEVGAVATPDTRPSFAVSMPVPVREEPVLPGGAGGPPAIDLDVLAVADSARVATLVSEILESAVERGASRIQLLPYKEDFFLVFRVRGRLENIASAPISMQASLVDGFKAYARLGAVPANLPALGRMRKRIADRDVVLTVSSVPTVAGQRLVVSISPLRPEPRTLPELGVSDAETRALHAMVERGRGLLLVCAPVAGGRSSTYYALLAHAAAAGKTVYSVERSVEYEIPAVAQVLVNPGSPVGAASYFAAGMRQDTDVLAIDGLESVAEIHLAIEAAGLGKLVIATFASGDIASGVRRMLDLGAEPNSLASALTLGVGQRVVRTNCPSCSVEMPDQLAQRIPGAPKGLGSTSGAGCDACGKSGFAGVTGIYEVLPFTEVLRAAVARAGAVDDLQAAAKAAGMRNLLAAGLARVADGSVSVQELDRVLRFSE